MSLVKLFIIVLVFISTSESREINQDELNVSRDELIIILEKATSKMKDTQLELLERIEKLEKNAIKNITINSGKSIPEEKIGKHEKARLLEVRNYLKKKNATSEKSFVISLGYFYSKREVSLFISKNQKFFKKELILYSLNSRRSEYKATSSKYSSYKSAKSGLKYLAVHLLKNKPYLSKVRTIEKKFSKVVNHEKN